MNIKIITTFTMLATSMALLTGCGGGSSGSGPAPAPAPAPHTITITGVSINLSNTTCKADSLLDISNDYHQSDLIFGVKWQTSSGDMGLSISEIYPYNDSTESTSELVYNNYAQSPSGLLSVNFAVGGGVDDSSSPLWDGGTELVCLDSSNNQVPIQFRTLDQNGNTLSQNTNISNLTSDYTGPITFQAYDLPASGIYLFDPNNPKAHAGQTILNNKNQL